MKHVASADVIVVDSVDSRGRSGDLIIAFHGDEICWPVSKSFPG